MLLMAEATGSGFIAKQDVAAWKRLGLAVARRREELGYSHREAARRSQSSNAIWSKLENGDTAQGRIQRLTANKIEEVLEWAPGSLENYLLHGWDPVLLRDKPTSEWSAKKIEELCEDLDDLQKRVKKLERSQPTLDLVEQILKMITGSLRS